jgi:hypothetical protein
MKYVLSLTVSLAHINTTHIHTVDRQLSFEGKCCLLLQGIKEQKREGSGVDNQRVRSRKEAQGESLEVMRIVSILLALKRAMLHGLIPRKINYGA